jgi:hypothetical protein
MQVGFGLYMGLNSDGPLPSLYLLQAWQFTQTHAPSASQFARTANLLLLRKGRLRGYSGQHHAVPAHWKIFSGVICGGDEALNLLCVGLTRQASATAARLYLNTEETGALGPSDSQAATRLLALERSLALGACGRWAPLMDGGC